MRTLTILATLAAATILSCTTTSGADTKTRVLLVTGGHDFEREPFFKLFKENPDITFKAVEHPNAHALLTAEAARDWDVLVTYDMHQPISEVAKANFIARLEEGKGLVVLHHAIASYQSWPEYEAIIGAKYYLEPTKVKGVEKARSLWKHDVNLNVQIADPNHPVTAGLSDFEIHDEAYKLFDVAEGVHTLITTDEPLSNKVIGWAKPYKSARVVYLQLGHDHFAYENPNYQKLLRQAIKWAARRS